MIFSRLYKLFRLIITHTLYRFYLLKIGAKSIIYKPIWVKNLKYLSVGKSVIIFPNCRIELIDNYQGIKFNPKLILKDNVQLHQNAHITCAESIIIEQNVIIVSNVTITDIIHPHEKGSFPLNKNPIETYNVRIGENSQIYNNSVILPGTQLGKNTVVAANSVVSGVFPDNVILAGAPAKIIKLFSPKTQKWENY